MLNKYVGTDGHGSCEQKHLSRDARKAVFEVSNHIRLKPACTATEDS